MTENFGFFSSRAEIARAATGFITEGRIRKLLEIYKKKEIKIVL